MLQTANALAPELELDDMEVFNGLIKLQNNALDKLKAREVLNQSGQIELKLKLDRQAKQQNPGKYLNNYFNRHICLSFSLSIPCVRRKTNSSFCSLIKVSWYVPRVKNMHPGLPSDPWQISA